MTRPHVFLFALSLLVCMQLAPGSRASAATGETCAREHERAQTQQQQGSLREASKAALQCASEGCPRLVRADCAKLYDDLERRLASLVLAVRDSEGHDLVDVRVFANGALLVSRIEGRAVVIDPGVYHLVVQADGYLEQTRDITLHQTEKDRLLSVELTRDPSAVSSVAAPASSPSSASSSSASSSSASSSSVEDNTRRTKAASERGWRLPTVYALGAAGVVSLGLAAGFGIAGKRGLNDLEGSCKPGCTDHEVRAVHRDYIIANVAAAVGGAALLSAVAVYVFGKPHDERAPRPLAVQVAPLHAGAYGALHARF